MTVNQVQNLCETTREKLKAAIEKCETFLNSYSLKDLLKDNEHDAELVEFYRYFLSDLRRLLVFSELAYEKLGISLRRPHFNAEHAEKILYDVYHHCVNNFFFPKHESYSEDGRYAYTGQDAIRFRKRPCLEARNITLELSKIFEELRDDLSYYETDYITQRRMQGEKV
jgi:arsenate reductase-like glutaredoxin family protein